MHYHLYMRNREWLGHLFFAALLLVAYLPTLRAPLFGIDDAELYLQPLFLSPFGWRSLLGLLTPGLQIDFYPVRDLSYALDWWLFNGSLVAARMQNLALAGGCALLLASLLKRAGLSSPLSIVAAWSWALWPHHPETYAWISARKDLLALFFFLASLRLSFSPKLRFFSLPLFGASLLSKASFLPAPFLLAIAYASERAWKRRPREKSLEALLAFSMVLSILAALYFKQFYSTITDMTLPYPPAYRVQASLAGLGRAVTGWLVPYVNAVDVVNWGDWLEHNRIYAVAGVVCYLLVGAGTALAWIRKSPVLLLASAGALLLYLPVSGLIFPHRNFYSVRYLEPSFLLLFGCVVLLNGRALESRRKWLPLAPFLLFVVHSFTARVWASPTSVTLHAVQVSPGSIPLRAQLLGDLWNRIQLGRLAGESMKAESDHLSALLAGLEKDCESPDKKKYEIDPCTLYYRHRFELADQLGGRKERYRDAYLRATASVNPRLALWWKFAFALKERALTRELAAEFLSADFPPRSTESRVYLLLASCLSENKTGQALFREYESKHLIRPADLERHAGEYGAGLISCLASDPGKLNQ